MSIVADKATIRFEDYLARPDRRLFELVDGELVEVHMSLLSSNVALRVAGLLDSYCRQSGAGTAFGSELTYRCFPDHPQTGRRPDISFIRKERLPADWQELGYSTIPPDLAVEVVSTNDLAYELAEKTQQYLSAGVPLIWVIYPVEQFVDVLRLDGGMVRLQDDDRLEGEDVLPGFSCAVADLFPPVE